MTQRYAYSRVKLDRPNDFFREIQREVRIISALNSNLHNCSEENTSD